MSDKADIRDVMQTLAGTKGESRVAFSLANVDSVDIASRTCTVTLLGGMGEVTFENVLMMAAVDDGILLVPRVDSTIIVGYSTYIQPFICQLSGVEKVLIVSGENNASLQIDADGLQLEINDTKVMLQDGLITLNDGALGGLVKLDALVERMNLIENKVNSLLTKYNSHTHVLTLSTGTGTAAPTTSTEAGTLTPTEPEQIENEKIIQG
jgi:hypothetical protein